MNNNPNNIQNNEKKHLPEKIKTDLGAVAISKIKESNNSRRAECLEKIGEWLDLKKIVDFYDDNANILHVSRYHREGFKTHCLLVIGNIMDEYESGNVSEEAVVAAFLHDIAKPRTAALNKRNEACFYHHEEVTMEEMSVFLNPNYPGFENVMDLVHGHMLPHSINENTPEPYRQMNKDKLSSLLDKHDEQFKNNLMVLADCDSRASVKSDDDLPEAERKTNLIRTSLIRF